MDEFKLIVAGGRDFNDYKRLSDEVILLSILDYSEKAMSIVSGCARGADALGQEFAVEHSVKLYEFPADWNRHGKAAGHIRNEEMGRFADGLLAFWDGRSRGTAHMIKYMETLGKPAYVVRY